MASRSSTISFGACAWASRKRSTNSASIAGAVVGDPAVAVGFRRGMLQPVQRALASERRAAPVPRLEPTKHHPEHRVVPQPVVVDQVLVAERNPEHPLPDQRRHLMHNPLRRRPSVKQAAKRSTSPVARSVAPSKSLPAFEVIAPPPKSAITARPSTRANTIGFALHYVGIGELSCGDRSLLSQKHFPTFRTPMHLPLVRNAG